MLDSLANLHGFLVPRATEEVSELSGDYISPHTEILSAGGFSSLYAVPVGKQQNMSRFQVPGAFRSCRVKETKHITIC